MSISEIIFLVEETGGVEINHDTLADELFQQ